MPVVVVLLGIKEEIEFFKIDIYHARQWVSQMSLGLYLDS